MSKIHADHQKIWENTGIASYVNKCKDLLKERSNRSSLLDSSNTDPLTKTLYYLINEGVQGNAKKEIVLNAMEYLSSLNPEIPSLIADVYFMLECEISELESQATERSNLSFMVKSSEKFISDRLLKERLENEVLEDMKIIDKSYKNKYIKVKTKLYYKQKKFNLFREECEGYAKLITELNQGGSNTNTSYMMEVIKSLIGCFNLDPNRVLDLILDSFENHIELSEVYIPLLKAYMPQSKTLSDVLGFKYVYYTEAQEMTPKSLYIITAFLLQHEAVSLEDIYGWLQPCDSVIAKDWEVQLNEAQKRFKENSAIVVSTKEKETEDESAVDENEFNKKFNNQKFGLLEALLCVGEWKTFRLICDKLPETYVVSQYPIAYSLCQLIHLLIDPLYRSQYENARNLCNTKPKVVSNPLAPKQVTSFLGLRDDIFPMLYTIGSYLSYDPELVYKVIRILKLALVQAGINNQQSTPSADSLYFDILTVMDLTILPTLSALQCNSGVAEEIWDVLKLYPYNFRYALYARWKNDSIQNYPSILNYNCESLKKIKEIMKKITKETTKLAGRQIGKLTHCSPGLIIEYILNQIMMFDNLIMFVVESLKYVTSLSFDVLAYCIIEMLMQPNRANSKQTNGTTSSWLVNLGQFCGSIFKKYNIELTGILQYVCNQMKIYKSFDLLILKDIVQKMSGIEFNEDITGDQLAALSGGEILRSEGGYFTHIRNTKKSSSRLKDALMENNLAMSLCLLIGQQRDCIVYKEATEVRLAGSLYDQCQDTLVQFGTYLNGVLSIDDYVEKLPPIEKLLSEYHLRTDVAFFLSRPKINFTLQAKFDELKKLDPNSKKWTENDKLSKYSQVVAIVTAPILESIQPLYPSKVWDDMSPKFIILFWSLSMYDLEVPTASYQKEIAKLRAVNEELRNSKELTAIKIRKEQERNGNLIEKLKEEMRKQQEHVLKVNHRLKTEKDAWFKTRDAKTAKNETITQFLQHCLFPRCIFTMVDAMYCAKFIHILHSLKTPNFSTLLCYDRLFCDIVYSVTLCTENEARRYGRFLCAVLETVMKWHSSKIIFENECLKYPGFITKFRVSDKFSDASDDVGYENFRHVCHKWHYKVTKALVVCLESKEYIQMRNALIILIKILPHFPVLTKLAQIIEKKVEKIIEDEKKKSLGLTTLAVSYNGLLKQKTSSFIREQDFHMCAPSVAPSVKSDKSNSVKPSATTATINRTTNMNSPIAVVMSSAEQPAKGVAHEADKAKVIDLEREEVKNDSKNGYEHGGKNNDEHADKERPKEEKRDVGEKKLREKKIKEEKLSLDDYKDDYRSSAVKEDRSKSNSYRSESSNSWHDYGSPRDDDSHIKFEITDRGEGGSETKRRKINSSSSSSKHNKTRSSSNSPELSSPPDKKEKRSKSKRATRSASVVDLEDPSRDRKRDVGARKRVRADEDELLSEKKKKSDDRSKSHQNGDDLKILYAEKHHAATSSMRERKTREKSYPVKRRSKS